MACESLVYDVSKDVLKQSIVIENKELEPIDETKQRV